MKKVWKLVLLGLTTVALAAGCSSKESETAVEEVQDSVVLGQYKGVTYTPVVIDITDEDVEGELQSFVDTYPTYVEVDRPAEEGDTVNIDYVGLKDGVAFDGGTYSGYDLVLGSGTFIDGFEDGLIGVKTGDELDLNLTFPEDYYSEDLAGQDVIFAVTVNGVYETVESTLDDEFVAEYTDYTTVEELRDAIKTAMEEEVAQYALYQKQDDVFQKVMDDSQVTVSDTSVEEYFNSQYEAYEQQAAMYGMDMDTFVTIYGMDLDEFKSQLMDIAEEATKQNLVIRAIADAEGITVDDTDREELALSFGYDDAASMIDYAGQDTVDNYIYAEKVITYIADEAVAE